MADRDVLIKPRKIDSVSTMANLLTKVKSFATVANTVAGVSNDEIFSAAIDGTAALFIGDIGGKVQGATETDATSTALTPVVTQTGLLPRDLLASPTDANAGNFIIHMYDQNTTPTVTGIRHRAFSLLKLKDYIGGAAVAAIGKVKIDTGDGADFLESKLAADTAPSFVGIAITKDSTAVEAKKLKLSATVNVSSQFSVTGAKQLTITSISGGSL